MISAIVLMPRASYRDPPRQHEIVVRSLVWLVSAVVEGIVRDVLVAAPPSLRLRDIADQAGCGLVEGDDDATRLAAAAQACRCPRVLVLEAGFHPDGDLIDEIESAERRSAPDASFALLSKPNTFFQRLFPDTARTVGVLTPRARLTGQSGDLATLMRQLRQVRPLRTRLQDIT